MMDLKKRISSMTLILILAFVFTVTLGMEISYGFTSTDADTAMTSFDNAFYTGSGGNNYFKIDTTGGGPDFWKGAEMIEMVEDAYDRSGSSTYRTMIDNLYNGFCYYFGTNWMGNKYNDDIMWMVLVCLRAYQITGNSNYLNQAKTHFDQVYSRGYDTTLGGGIWWTTDKGEKNSCINCPAIIAACKLYQNLGDSAYLTKAQSLYTWQTSKLWDSATGAIYDNITSGNVVNKGATTYNQGTFIGASNLLYKITATSSYYNNAVKVLDYTKNNMTTSSILRSESGTADTGGFKGIFCRYALQFTKDNNITSYNSWFQLNANTAWSHKDSRGLMDQNWSVQTGTGVLQSWWCSAAVVLLQVCPPDSGTTPSPTPAVTPTSTPVSSGDKCAGGTISVSNTNSPAGEDMTKAFDDLSTTKWLIGSSTGWIQYDFAGTLSWAINQYTITSANDAPARDPKNWTLQGSNNGTTWTVVDTRSNETFASRYLKKTYSFTNTTAYQMYRLNVSSNSGDTNLQIAEIEMFAGTSTTPTPTTSKTPTATKTPTPSRTPTPTATSTPSSGVIFYQNADWGGTASQTFAKGTYTTAQLSAKGCPNDWMSSLRVPSGWTVIVYQYDNFTGTSWTFTADSNYVGAACNDQMSSCKIQ